MGRKHTEKKWSQNDNNTRSIFSKRNANEDKREKNQRIVTEILNRINLAVANESNLVYLIDLEVPVYIKERFIAKGFVFENSYYKGSNRIVGIIDLASSK